jgi:AbrB family looped-hinge helix DNA binding protein
MNGPSYFEIQADDIKHNSFRHHGWAHYRGTIEPMPLAHSKITAQGQTSVPLEVRRKLGIGPGSVLEWDEEGEAVIVRRAGRYSSEEIHRKLFPEGTPPSRKLGELKKGIRQHIKKRYAGD